MFGKAERATINAMEAALALHDPVPTAAEVLAWARTKPPTEEYIFTDVSRCAVTQFLNATGCETVSPAVFEAAGTYPFTFGGFVERLAVLS